MLLSLHIENIAVIKSLDVDFSEGFHALTGETGAGKSILIDSIRLLLGDRADRELIRTGETRAMVSALFRVGKGEKTGVLSDNGIEPDENGELLIQRTLDADGRSTARINGRSVSVSLLRQIGSELICIHGQHDSVRLLDAESHLPMLDAFGKTEELLTAYTDIYRAVTAEQRSLRSLMNDERDAARKAELLRYQIGEIDALKLKAGEDTALKEQKLRLSQAEKISKNCRVIYRALYRNEKGGSAATLLTLAEESVRALDTLYEDGEQTVLRLESIKAELEEIALRAEALGDFDGEDPAKRLGAIEDRLADIEKLERKYGDGSADACDAILRYRAKCAAELYEIENRTVLISEGKKKLAALAEKAKEAATALHTARIAAATELEQGVKKELCYLDMENVDFKVGITDSIGPEGKRKLLPTGMDVVEFCIATGPGEPLRPLVKIASGGELSRIMLALKCVFCDKDQTDALIFDEIDTGVSGKTAEKIGHQLRTLGKTAQVFCVTHSAQVASAADRHYRIVKNEVDGRNETTLQLLDDEGRVAELSRIIGGIDITSTVKETAKEMLSHHRIQ